MFENAKAIYIKNKRGLTNFQSGYKCSFRAEPGKRYVLNITGASLYSVYLNGGFIFYGPARAPHGYVRYDELELDVKDGMNTLCVELAGYNCPCFYIPDIKPFLMAEIFEEEESVAYTGRDFSGVSLDSLRRRNVYRYSFQRAFTEVWRLDNSDPITNWKSRDTAYEPVCEHVIDEEIIAREWPMPRFETDLSAKVIRCGRFLPKKDMDFCAKRFISSLSESIIGFLPQQIPDKLMEETYGVYFCDGLGSMEKDRYTMYEFRTVNTGFINTAVKALEDSEIYLVFGERMDESNMYGGIYSGASGDDTINIVKYKLKKSAEPYMLMTFECYTFKYIAILVREGRINVESVSLTEYSYPDNDQTQFKCDDTVLQSIFDAARNTYRQNVLDTFMDCPGRERGGWLCDSYFTGRASMIFSGNAEAEGIFLKNFARAKYFPGIPEGMLPHNYPGEDRGFIPQWALWYILEVYEYILRSGDDCHIFKNIVCGILSFFSDYETKDGLLGKTPGWNFIEWSLANEIAAQADISFPTNMLYAKALECAGELFNDTEFSARARKIRRIVTDTAFDGVRFADGAVLTDAGTALCSEVSEACQYYAAYFDFAPREDRRFDRFYDVLLNVCGTKRKETRLMPEMAYPSLFIGLTLRLCVLEKLGENDRLLSEIKEIYGPMAAKTGTLWELESETGGSLCHGYSSIAAWFIVQALNKRKER